MFLKLHNFSVGVRFMGEIIEIMIVVTVVVGTMTVIVLVEVMMIVVVDTMTVAVVVMMIVGIVTGIIDANVHHLEDAAVVLYLEVEVNNATCA